MTRGDTGGQQQQQRDWRRSRLIAISERLGAARHQIGETANEARTRGETPLAILLGAAATQVAAAESLVGQALDSGLLPSEQTPAAAAPAAAAAEPEEARSGEG